MSTVTLRYWAAAKQAAGVAEETISARTLAAALEAVLARERDPAAAADCDLRAILARSSFLVHGSPVGTRAPETVRLPEAAVVEVLPPFASRMNPESRPAGEPADQKARYLGRGTSPRNPGPPAWRAGL